MARQTNLAVRWLLYRFCRHLAPSLTTHIQNTNVVKLFKQINLDTPKKEAGYPQQFAYYSSGIGTHAKKLPFLLWLDKVISDKLDQALAWFVPFFLSIMRTDGVDRYRNIVENVKDAYGWLARKYREGDRVYLFGGSKPATTSLMDLNAEMVSGFSRGAYQVRVLACLIHEVRLIVLSY